MFALWYKPQLHNHIPSSSFFVLNYFLHLPPPPRVLLISAPLLSCLFFLSPASAAGCRAQQRPSPCWLWAEKTPTEKPWPASAWPVRRHCRDGTRPLETIILQFMTNFLEKPPLCTVLERHFPDTGTSAPQVLNSKRNSIKNPDQLSCKQEKLHCANFWTHVQNSHKQHLNSLKCPKPLLRALQVCWGKNSPAASYLSLPLQSEVGRMTELNPLTTLQRSPRESKLIRNDHDRSSSVKTAW